MNPKMIMIISILAVQTILWIFLSITVPSYYELLDNAVYVIDIEKGKELIQSHKECFKVYAENCVVDCPTCWSNTSDQCYCYAFLDHNFKYYKQEVYLKQLTIMI